jgi:hypothetical protein
MGSVLRGLTALTAFCSPSAKASCGMVNFMMARVGGRAGRGEAFYVRK